MHVFPSFFISLIPFQFTKKSLCFQFTSTQLKKKHNRIEGIMFKPVYCNRSETVDNPRRKENFFLGGGGVKAKCRIPIMFNDRMTKEGLSDFTFIPSWAAVHVLLLVFFSSNILLRVSHHSRIYWDWTIALVKLVHMHLSKRYLEDRSSCQML